MSGPHFRLDHGHDEDLTRETAPPLQAPREFAPDLPKSKELKCIYARQELQRFLDEAKQYPNMIGHVQWKVGEFCGEYSEYEKPFDELKSQMGYFASDESWSVSIQTEGLSPMFSIKLEDYRGIKTGEGDEL